MHKIPTTIKTTLPYPSEASLFSGLNLLPNPGFDCPPRHESELAAGWSVCENPGGVFSIHRVQSPQMQNGFQALQFTAPPQEFRFYEPRQESYGPTVSVRSMTLPIVSPGEYEFQFSSMTETDVWPLNVELVVFLSFVSYCIDGTVAEDGGAWAFSAIAGWERKQDAFKLRKPVNSMYARIGCYWVSKGSDIVITPAMNTYMTNVVLTAKEV